MEQLDNMTWQEQMDAYAAVKVRFGLKWRQRNALDVSTHYGAILTAAHQGDWDHAEELLLGAGIVTP